LTSGFWSRADWLIAVAIMVVGISVGSVVVNAFTKAGHQPSYYQAEFGPAVLWACGRGFVNPPDRKVLSETTTEVRPANSQLRGFDALAAFLGRQREAFDCSELPASFVPNPPGLFQAGHRYLLMSAAAVWSIFGISWTALNLLGPIFVGTTASCVYLLARVRMGRLLALSIAALWMSSPLQFMQLPHLRDVAKAPFFMFTLCAVAWIVLTRQSRRQTVAALALIGAVLGFGFGFRTDVASYLPLVVLAVLVFRPGFERADLMTRGIAATAAVGAYLAVAWPIIAAYQTGDNLAHVALLGLSDPSRDWLGLRDAPYSYGHWYDDGYVATVISAYAERLTTLTTPLTLGTLEYAKWGNDYYTRVIHTFPGDMLVRAWAAVLAVFELPFAPINATRPPFIDPAFDWIFTSRAWLLSWLRTLPPAAVVTIFAVGLGSANIRLGLLFFLVAIIMPGMTAIQFQGRHVFHLEVLSLLAYGCLLNFVYRLAWHREMLHGAALRPAATRALLVSLTLAALVIAPLATARAYQQRSVTRLFSEYESAAVVSAGSSAVQQGDGEVLVPVALATSERLPHYIETNVLSIQVGGAQCDTDMLPVTFRYQAQPPFGNLTRQQFVAVPPAGGTTRLIYPAYTLGARGRPQGAIRFVGIELPARHLSCIQSIERFTQPERFPLLLEARLVSDWRQRPLHEALRNVEPMPENLQTQYYSDPEGFQPSRSSLPRLVREPSMTSFRSRQVVQLDEHGIDIRGRADTPDAYILVWPYQEKPKGSVFFLEGQLHEGGLTVGIQQNDRWALQVNVLRPGPFRASLRLPESGRFGAILANNLQQGANAHITVTRYGWLPPEP
jgi:hypothetical protein